jgi:hypothetical protein
MHLHNVRVVHRDAEEVAERAIGVVAAVADRPQHILVAQDVAVVKAVPAVEDVHPGTEHAVGDVEFQPEGLRVGWDFVVEVGELLFGDLEVQGTDIVEGIFEAVDETHLHL